MAADLRILLLHNRYRMPGGEERHLSLLDEVMRQLGAEVRLLEAPPVVRAPIARRVALGVGMTYRPSSYRAVRRIGDAWRPDIVHAHNILPSLTASALHAAKASGARVVLTAHNYRLFCPSGTLLRHGRAHDDCVRGSSLLCALRGGRRPWAERFAYGIAIELQRRLRLVDRWVDAYVAPSSTLAGKLVESGIPGGKIHVIPSGVEVHGWRARRRSFGLFCGRLSPEKGIEPLLAAARSVPEVPIVVAGDGPMVEQVRAQNTNLSYVGYVTGERLERLQEQAAFTLVPSEWEDIFPMTALESLAAGTPVIASDVGGLSDMIREPAAGLLVPPKRPDLLAEAMRRLWAQSQLDAEYGRPTAEYAAARFSRARFGASLRALYGDLVERS